MEYDAKVPPWSTADKLSFAYPSARERWPVIITQGIDGVHRATAAATDPEVISEGKHIVSELAKLKYELQHDRILTPLPDDGQPDIAGYNKELEQLSRDKPLHWLDAPWLFSECYMYRRMHIPFSTAKTSYWRSYDLFARQKISTFRQSRAGVLELAARYKDIVTQLESKHAIGEAQSPEELEKAEELLFIEMCEICLWGNATDLSLLTNISLDEIKKLQGAKARKESEKNILVNELSAAFRVLNLAMREGKEERRVDFVLDNAGFELFVDLVLAGYLLSTGLATTVVLHPKRIPWFVSDVVPRDFAELLNALNDARTFYTEPDEQGKKGEPLSETELAELNFLFDRWSEFHAEGQLVIRPHGFWTQGGSYRRLPYEAPELFEDLKSNELVIFKGDLNYRKVVGDLMWPATTPFGEAIGELGHGLRVLTLRTCKGDVVVGLPQGLDEELRAMEGGGGDTGARMWAWKGKWAVCQFFDGKKEKA